MSSVLLELPGPREARGGLWYSTPASTRFGRHYHRELELNIVVAGEVSYWFAHRELRVVGPAALWIPPLVEHELLDASPDLSLWVCSLKPPSGGALQPLWSDADRKLSHGPHVSGLAPAGLARVCERARAGLLRPERPHFDAVLVDIFAAAWSAQSAPPTRGERAAHHPAARRAARLLREADSPESMAELARSSSLSRERLSRVFAHSFGIGLVQYRNHHRVQQFIHDYGDGSGSNMLRAALDVGFGSYVQFHRAFKQVVGHPPAQHLELVRGGVVDPARTGYSGR